MTPTMRKRILWAFLGLVLLVGALVAATPYLVNIKVVKKEISKQVSDWMGLPVYVEGEPVITAFPYLTVKLKDMTITSSLGADQPPLASIAVLKAEMAWLPLLVGNFEVRRFYLENPVFEFVRDMDGRTSWDMTRGSLVSPDASDGGLSLSYVSLGNFTIDRGRARYEDKRSGQIEQFSDINLTFDWPNTADAAAIKGGFLWRNEPISFDARSGKPMELFDAGLSPLSLTVGSPLFETQIDGTAATMSNLQFEGDFQFETTSLKDLLSWLDLPFERGAALGATTMKARAHLVGASVDFSDMMLQLGENSVDGVLQLDFRRERALIQGTLASDDLDLSPFLQEDEKSKSWLDRSFSASDLDSADIDVRLSANKLKIGPIELGRTASTLVTRNQQLSFSISEAFAYGGRLETSIDMRPSKESPNRMVCHIRAKANGILAGTFAREVTNSEFLTGTALAELDLQGEGNSLREMFRNANGDLSLVLTEGGMNRFNLDSLQDALETGADVEPDALFEGGSSFDVLSVQGTMVDEKIALDGLRVTSGNRALYGFAELDVATMALDFPGTLALYRSSDPASHSSQDPVKEIPFLLQGPLAQPTLSQRIVEPEATQKSQEQTAGDATEPANETEPDNISVQDGNPEADIDQSEPQTEASDESGAATPNTSEDTEVKSFGEAAEELLQQGASGETLLNPLISNENGLNESVLPD